MSENEIRVLYVQPGKYPEERTIPNTLRALQELVGGDFTILFVFFLCRLGAKSCRLAGSRASLLVRVLCFCYN